MTPPPGASADRDPDARAYPERVGTPPQQASDLSPDRSGPAIPAPASRTRTRLRRFVHEVTYQHGIHPALVPGVSIEDQQVRYRVDKVVLLVVGALVLGFVAWGVTRPDDVLAVSSAALSWVTANLGWLFSLLAIGMVVFLLTIAFSRYGDITLGLDGEEPASDAAVTGAMAQAALHWGVNAWAIYAVVGLAVAYVSYRRGRVPLMSSILMPLFGRGHRTDSFGARLIDSLAIIATLFGTAASLGIGALQIGRGVEIVTGWSPGAICWPWASSCC